MTQNIQKQRWIPKQKWGLTFIYKAKPSLIFFILDQYQYQECHIKYFSFIIAIFANFNCSSATKTKYLWILPLLCRSLHLPQEIDLTLNIQIGQIFTTMIFLFHSKAPGCFLVTNFMIALTVVPTVSGYQ